MSEVVIIVPERTSVNFHTNLHPDDDDLTGVWRKTDVHPSRKSWKLQLLRLVQEAPQPSAVICNEPRRFPHFGIGNRVSISSWASDATCSTIITENGSTSFTPLIGKKGGNENKNLEQGASSPPPLPLSHETSPPTLQVHPCLDTIEKGNNADSACPSGGRMGDLETCANNGRDNQKETKGPPQKQHSNISPTTGNHHVPQGHQVQEGSSECEKNRLPSTVSLSIKGDSEYWEKFRYSKDYQSSLMIETICNEVFNLNPSPRYRSLVKLSQKNKGTRKKKGKEEESSQMPKIEPSNEKDGEGVKIQTSDKQQKEEEKTKDKVEHSSTQQSHHTRDDETSNSDPTNNASVLCSPPHHQENRNKDDGVDDKDGADDVEREQQRQSGERKESYFSTASSAFTTTTNGEEDDENFNECRLDGRVERMLMTEGFGPVFHGYLTKGETESLLRNEGQYLIRQVWKEDGFMLSFRLDGEVRNYRILCRVEVPTRSISRKNSGSDDHSSGHKYRFYLEDRRKCYNSLDELVQEGLLTLHLDENAGSYVDLLVELAQFQRNENLLLTPAAAAPTGRKTSRSASLRAPRITSSSSGGTTGDGGARSSSSITAGRNSMEIALVIHYFEEELFDGLAKCQICTHGLWGPSWKGLRCRDCGLVVHESCIDNVKNGCKPDLRTISPFSTDLTTLVKGSCSTTAGSPGLPYILEKCINELEARGIGTEGIYRVSGSVEELENLKNLFEREKTETDLTACEDFHSITGLVKLFLRQLPESLITQEVFEEYSREDRGELTTETVQNLLMCLPPAHKLTLRYFLGHLSRVTKEKATNKMNAFNLSSVLLPSFIGPNNMSFDTLESGAKLLYFLITHEDQLKF